MMWLIVVCGVLGWVLLSLPLAVAVGRSFAAAAEVDEGTPPLPSPGFEPPSGRVADERGPGSAVA